MPHQPSTPEKSVEEILRDFQKLSLTFVVGEGVIEHHAKLSNFFLETLTAERQKREEVVAAERERIANTWYKAVREVEMKHGFMKPAMYRIKIEALTHPNNPK